VVPVKKVVVDTNVFISGFGWDGKPGEILDLLQSRSIENYITSRIFQELQRVVAYPRLKFPETLRTKIIEFVLFHSEFVEPKESVAVVIEDPDDNKFVECAVEANAEFIISGDPHLLRLKKFKDIKLIDVDRFLNILSKKSS
jgi:uncharacterized protein